MTSWSRTRTGSAGTRFRSRAKTTRKTSSTVELQPQKLTGTLAFMLESRWTILPTAQAMAAPFRQPDYDAVWSGLMRNFR